MAREIGINAGLKYVYTGNVPGENGEKTFCYNCSRILIDRWGYTINKNLIENSRCPHCGVIIDGVGM
jgi:pyruvate formate lyase activating enzyme